MINEISSMMRQQLDSTEVLFSTHQSKLQTKLSCCLNSTFHTWDNTWHVPEAHHLDIDLFTGCYESIFFDDRHNILSHVVGNGHRK